MEAVDGSVVAPADAKQASWGDKGKKGMSVSPDGRLLARVRWLASNLGDHRDVAKHTRDGGRENSDALPFLLAIALSSFSLPVCLESPNEY